MATAYLFNKLNKKAQEKALEDFRNVYVYPDWDDVSSVTEMLQEDLRSFLGVIDEEDKLYWNSCPLEVTINVSEFDFVHLEKIIAEPNMSMDYKYGEYSGAEILEKQKDVISALNHCRCLVNLGLDTVQGCGCSGSFQVKNNQVENKEECYEEHPELVCLQHVLCGYIDFCQYELGRILEAEIDYRYSDEFLKEEIQGREIEFDYRGNLREDRAWVAA